MGEGEGVSLSCTRLIVLGNCQARPMSDLLRASTRMMVLDPIILHLAKKEQELKYMEMIASCDIILAQYTSPDFDPPYLASNKLKSQFGKKVVVWPNLFFVGQQPYLRYLTHLSAGRVFGPLEANHDLRFLNEWFSDRKGEVFCDEIWDVDYLERISSLSLKELYLREASCDLKIADIVARERNCRKLFFTFNHPTLWLLESLAKRFSEFCGVDFHAVQTSKTEPLGRFQPPGLSSKSADKIFGLEVLLDVPDMVKLGSRRKFTYEEIRDASFACYDHLISVMDQKKLRITPRY